MPREDSLAPADWLRIARKDLSRVRRALRDRDPEMGAFYLQRSVEKHLKAFLLSGSGNLRRIHGLETLPDDALAHDPGLAPYHDSCENITAYYFPDRYPLLHAALGKVTPLLRRLHGAIGPRR